MSMKMVMAVTAVGLIVASDAQARLAYALTDGNALVAFDTNAPSPTISSVKLRSTTNTDIQDLIDIDYRPSNNTLYGVGQFGQLYTIDPMTGVATAGSTLSVSLTGSRFGIDFNPVPDRLRIVNDNDQNLRVNADTGAVTVDGTLKDATLVAPNTPTITDVAYTNPDTNGATGTTIYYLDAVADALYTATDPNSGSVTKVGTGLGFDISAINGFDISVVNGTNVGYAALQRTANGSSEFFTIDLTTGTATSQGLLGGGDVFDGLAVTVPEPTTLAAIAGAGLVVLRRRPRRA